MLLVLSGCMGAIGAWAGLRWMLSEQDAANAALSLLIAVSIGVVFGLSAFIGGRKAPVEEMTRRDAMLLVALTWLVGAALSATPFFIWAHLRIGDGAHPFTSFIDCYFEAMSGLTTTGATVLTDIGTVPRGLLLWRAMTHWLGGLGIVVLFVAVLPMLGVGAKKLFQIEAAGPTQQGVRPRIAETARVLWMIYLLLTVAQTLLLHIAGMTWFEAVCHTFATLATGGFSTSNASIGHWAPTPWIDGITIVFMILAGMNFGLYYQIARGRIRQVWHDREAQTYLATIGVVSIIIAVYLVGSPIVLTTGDQIESANATEALRYSIFQVVSIQTTTGFATADFNLWPFLPKALLVAVMFVGGSAGSTGGGIKVIRIMVMFKLLVAQIEKVFNPSVVRTTRIGRGVVDDELARSVLVYVLAIFLLSGLGTVAIKLFEPAGSISIVTAATASIACLNNIGPGLEMVGAVENFSFFSWPSKVLLTLWMALGRLEVYALLVLVTPSFWRQA